MSIKEPFLVFIWIFLAEVDYLYFFFLQDLVGGNWDLVPVSWSLVIEEWFYLVFPLLIVLCSFFNKKSAFLFFCELMYRRFNFIS